MPELALLDDARAHKGIRRFPARQKRLPLSSLAAGALLYRELKARLRLGDELSLWTDHERPEAHAHYFIYGVRRRGGVLQIKADPDFEIWREVFDDDSISFCGGDVAVGGCLTSRGGGMAGRGARAAAAAF